MWKVLFVKSLWLDFLKKKSGQDVIAKKQDKKEDLL